MFSTNYEKFAALFNKKFPGAYRRITADDVKAMTKCRLIGHYGAYFRGDLELVRGLLQYEQTKKRISRSSKEDKAELPKCKRCKRPLPHRFMGKKGRPREYCLECETLRNAERQRKHSVRKKKLLNKSHLLENIKGL